MDYATSDELAERWRPLSVAEKAQADALLADASQILRRRLASHGVDLDAEIESGSLSWIDARIVVIGMVRRTMQVTAEGVGQQSQTAGPFAMSTTFVNPQGNLYVSDSELTLLLPVTQTRKFKSVRMAGL